jgi:hypothetical protein
MQYDFIGSIRADFTLMVVGPHIDLLTIIILTGLTFRTCVPTLTLRLSSLCAGIWVGITIFELIT